jgi:aspartate racemase
MHPNIVMSAVPMGLSIPGWESNDHAAVAKFLSEGVQLVADAGADFYVCPDNTAHIVLEQIAADLPLPGLHIAALKTRGLEMLVPDEQTRERLNTAIFDELCLGIFNTSTTDHFLRAIEDLKSRGSECVILGCTEIPLIVTEENSPLPAFDSTRLLAKYAVREAISERPIPVKSGWLPV